MLNRFSGSHPICPTANSLSPLEASLEACSNSVWSPPGVHSVHHVHSASLSIKHRSDYHKYADDTELEKAALPSDFRQVSRETEVCVADGKDWMNKN